MPTANPIEHFLAGQLRLPHQAKQARGWLRALALACLLLTAGAPHAAVSLPNGDWREEDVEELRVKVIGGWVRVTRDYVFDKWQINARWNGLGFETDVLDGSIKRITRNEAVFEKQGDAYVFGRRAVIRAQPVQRLPGGSAQGSAPADPSAPGTTPGSTAGGGLPLESLPGYRWINRDGQWVDYDSEGKVVAYGDRNDIRVWLEYGPSGSPNAGRLIAVRDHFGRTVLTYGYDANGRISQITDTTDTGPSPRKVQFAWTGALLTQLTDVRGYATTYTYENTKLKTATDAEGRTWTLTWGPTGRVSKVTAPDGGISSYQYDYDKLKRIFYARQDGPATAAGSPVLERWYDADGREIRLDLNGVTHKKLLYDSANRQQTITDSLGRVTRVTTDEFDNPVKVIHPDGSQSSARYSPVHGQVLEATDELGIKTRYTYDAKGQLTAITEAADLPEQRVTDVTVDAWGQVRSQTARGSPVLLPDGSQVPVADATVEYRYDTRGNRTRLIDAEGNARDYQIDSAGNLRRITDPLGNVWQFDFDPAGSLTRSEDPLGRTGSQAYDKVGNRTRLTDPAGKTQQYVHDSLDRRIQTLDAYGKVATLDYDKNGRALGGSDEDGRPLGLTDYNLDGFPVKTTDPKGNVTQVYYQDTAGQAAPPGMAVRVVYPTHEEHKRLDARNRVTLDTRIQGPETLAWAYAYDPRGLIQRITDPAGKTVVRDHDAYGRLIRTRDPLNRLTHYAYDTRGNLIAVQDPKGHTLRYTYDRANRRTAEIRPLGQTTTYTHDAAGNLTRITYPSGIRHEFDHDDAGQRVAQRSYHPGQTSPEHSITYTYDPNGRLSGWTDTTAGTGTPAGVTRSLITRDDNGQQTSETVNYGPFSLGYHYAWQANGYRKSLTYPDNYTVTYTWAEHDELQAIDLPGEGPIAVTDWQWLAPTRTGYPGGTLAERQVDGLFKLKQLTVKDPEHSTVLRVDNHYGPRQELARQTRDGQGGNRDTTYGYDDELRLTRASGFNGPLGSETYSHDPADNRITHSLTSGDWTYDANDRLIQKGGTTYAWDDDGRLTQKTENGRTWHYRYDSLHRLVQVDDGSGTPIAHYGYDPFDRRIWKETYDPQSTPGSPGAPQRQYALYSPQGRLADADANGTLIRSYGWRPDGGWETDPLFVRSGSGPSSPLGEGGSRIAYLHNDGQGSPLLATDKQGKVLWQADYSAFGRALIRNDSLNLALRRPGQWEDPETGLYYNTRRYYDPDTGRYLTQDPLGLGGGTHNYYGYTGGNPTNLTDPTGEFIPILMGMAARCVGQCLAWGAAGGLIGAALEYGLCDPVEDATLIGSAAGLAVGCLKECANPLNWIGGGRAKAVKGQARTIRPEPKMVVAKVEGRAEVGFGAVKEATLLLNGPIRITEKGMAHVVERHTVNDIAKFAGKSKFNEAENLSALINSGTQQRMVQQANGNFARTWDAGRSVGVDRVTGQQTSVMTVITRPNGELVTAFPGRP